MQILEYPFIWEWCRTHDAELDDPDDAAPRLRDDPALLHHSRLVFAPRGRSGHEPAVAAAIMDALGGWTECLLWITGWGVWPSSEDWPRYYALRARHGQRLSIDVAPGHLVTPADAGEFSELLLQVLEQGWDAVVLPARDGRVLPLRVAVSHDGWVDVHASQPVELTIPGL
ncbi:MAG TPA: hypothetical protein VFT45_10055 [Longimicrobium sp.]|nr:hypothetical protein [Longimicrobium sp.]